MVDCEQSLFSPSSLSSAGRRFAGFARFPRARDHPEGLQSIQMVKRRRKVTFT